MATIERMRRVLCALVAATLLLVAACGSTPSGAEPGEGPGASAHVYTIDESYTTVAHECTAGQTIHITGSTDMIQLVEPCGSILVAGTTNQVLIDRTRELRIAGRNQHISVGRVLSGSIQLGGRDNQLVCSHPTHLEQSGTNNQSNGC